MATNGGCTARRVLSPSTSLLADVLLYVLVGFGTAHTSGKVTAGVFFEFQRSDYPRAGEWLQTRAGWLRSKAPVLTARVGEELLLVEVHLSLNLVLPVG